ncbi:MAG: hypothetical protein ACK4VY_02340 [Brevundimonas sp.]
MTAEEARAVSKPLAESGPVVAQTRVRRIDDLEGLRLLVVVVSDPEVRLVAVRLPACACSSQGDRLEDLLKKLAVMRRDGWGAEAFGAPLAAKWRTPTVVAFATRPC